MIEAKIIKRYQNRKLYDPEDSKYVTLDQLDKTLKSGRDVRVIDNKSKNDITATALTQLMYEKERNGRTQPSVDLLKEIIRHGDGTYSGYIQAKMAAEFAKFDGDNPHQPPHQQLMN
ncbi:polyhydroxyalkanoate synthesis regulator DNA-binding domain-containing protein [Bdellovibrionota bacterium FG-2]